MNATQHVLAFLGGTHAVTHGDAFDDDGVAVSIGDGGAVAAAPNDAVTASSVGAIVGGGVVAAAAVGSASADAATDAPAADDNAGTGCASCAQRGDDDV